jgi:transposase
LHDDTATLLLGLDGVNVASAVPDESGNPMLALVTACADARCCPGCGVRSTRSLGLMTTRPRDLPLAGRPTSLRWTKRGNTGCPRRSFTESLPAVPRVRG